ncbi:hypothetical protein QE152_g7787 [Popillia japonica]|uniref:Uncharacterized protein n=1 Tax=Popillia japonica TaxID=7064 RepID=A0AAW1ME30_POPJA
MKETADSIKTENAILAEEISKLKPFETFLDEKHVQVTYSLYLTMVDGKVINALTGTSSQRCYICQCKPTEMNNLKNIKSFAIDEQNFQYGLSPLHARIKFLECILHISYKLDLQATTTRGASNAQKERIQERKQQIQKKLWHELGLRVDKVVQGGGTSNTGNVARRFFENPKEVAEITGVDENLIARFQTILAILTSGYELDHNKFDKFATETAELFIRKYGWYRMPVTVHKILIHGSQAIKHMLLPIGMLSEEAQEACNKIYKRFREHHTHLQRKSSRINTTRDLLHMLLVASDPVISRLRSSSKIHQRKLPNNALELIKFETDVKENKPSADDPEEEEDESEEEIEEEELNFF